MVLPMCIGTASAHVVEGTIYEDRSGSPLQSVLVRLSSSDGVVLKEVETGRDGRFLVEGLNAGEYRLAVTKANYMRLDVRTGSKPERVPEGTPSSVLRLIRYGVLSGRILPPRTGLVTLIERVGEGQIPRTFSASANSAGDYRLFNIPPGRYVLGVLNASAGTGVQRGLTLQPSSSAPREFMFHGGEDYAGVDVSMPQDRAFVVAGKLVGPGGSYLVSLISPDYPSLRLANTSVNASGEFRFERLVRGTYDLLVSSLTVAGAPAFFGRGRVSVISQDIQDLLISVEPARSAELTLQAASQDPQRRCSLDGTATVAPLEPWLLAQPGTVSVALDRPALLDGLAPTRYRVTVRSTRGDCTGAATLNLGVATGAVSLFVTFSPAGSITGSVRGTGPSMPVSVVLRNVDGGREAPVQAVFTSTGLNFVFENLLPGQYCAATYSEADATSQWAPDAGCAAVTFNLAAGGSASLELQR